MSEDDGEARSSFSGKMGLVMAAAASAVGLGNLWRFPYLTSHYGGGIFVLVYIITDEVEAEGNEFRFKRPFEYMIKYVCPICLASILIFGTLDMFGIFSLY